MFLAYAVLSGFGLALAAPFLYRRFNHLTGWVLALLPAGLTIYFVSLFSLELTEQPLIISLPWAPELGLFFSLRVDGLGLLFATLISGIGSLVIIYAGGYLKDNANLGRFYAWLLMFMAAMLGVALADNALLLFVFWELTSISSFILIGFAHERESPRAAALQALLVTGSGGLALLAGLLLLGLAGGSLELSVLIEQRAMLQASPYYTPALILILLGAFTKSAQFPFHFWLPNAMFAPTPVSAYLHSATMVKAGIYLLARLNPALGGTDLWFYAVSGVGLITMLAGGYLALTQTDLKRLLAYSTIGALGMLTMLIGLGSPLALEAAIVFFLAHALYKGALFLVAGSLEHGTGTRDITRLSGLFSTMKFTATSGIFAALSMAGLLPFFGFISKELTYESILEFGPWLTAAVVVASVFFVFVAGLVGIRPFFGRKIDSPEHPHVVVPSMWLGSLVLGTISLLIGLFPILVSSRIITPAASVAIGELTPVTLALWHGINPALILSALTLVLGAVLYAFQVPLRARLARLVWARGPNYLYEHSLDGLNALARWQTRVLQNGYLRYYLLTILLAGIGLAGFTLFTKGGLHWPDDVIDIRFYELALGILILGAAFTATVSWSRLSAVAALGTAGYGVGLIYLLFGAPDLAMTQFLIESLTVILFVLAFYHLPHFAQLTPLRSRLRDIVFALLAGGLMTTLVLSAVGLQLYPSISDYMVENAYPLAHGRNIVNVILVDFRGIDTMGEITVLSIAAIGVFALLRLRMDRQKTGDKE